MNKQVRMTARPKKNNTADQWVETSITDATEPAFKPKRLTIDIDPELHTRLKLRCVRRDIRIADFLRDLIEGTLNAEDVDHSSN